MLRALAAPVIVAAVAGAAVLGGAVISASTAAPARPDAGVTDASENGADADADAGSSGEVTSDSGAAGRLLDPAAAAGTSAIPADAIAVRIEIPSIGVASALETLAIDSTGELQAPVDPASAGWFAEGIVPGRTGPAIIAGHVDSLTAPAVFARLDEVGVGAQMAVTLSTGQVLQFEVYEIGQADKARFPTSEVYGSVPTPELRVITCAGDFDRTARTYADNLILYAALVA